MDAWFFFHCISKHHCCIAKCSLQIATAFSKL
jgi:hypothetical protein